LNILEVDSVSLTFGGRKILTDVYLKCETGNVVGLLGRNGSGKSSLMKIIFGTLRGKSQSVRLNGRYVEQLFKTPQTVHYLPQDGFAMNYLTFNDLVKIFRLEPALNRIQEVEEIGAYAAHKIGHLSGGVKKLVEIITVLYTPGAFVLLDEPFSYLSPVLVEKIIPHIRYQSHTKGIILTDHQYRNVMAVSNRRYIIAGGALKLVGNSADLEKYGYLTA
jgi:ABC-type multidrug transport system ATPase subunit